MFADLYIYRSLQYFSSYQFLDVSAILHKTSLLLLLKQKIIFVDVMVEKEVENDLVDLERLLQDMSILLASIAITHLHV